MIRVSSNQHTAKQNDVGSLCDETGQWCILRKQVSYMIGQHYYPLPSTRHYHAIEMFKYAWMPDALNTKTSSPFASMNSQMRGRRLPLCFTAFI